MPSMETQVQRQLTLKCLWLWMIVLIALGLVGSPRAEAMLMPSMERSAWKSKDGKLFYIQARDQRWYKYTDGKLSPHVYHEFRRNRHFVALYDLKRHLTLRLYTGALLARTNFRKALTVWIFSKHGTWVDLGWYRRQARAAVLFQPPSKPRAKGPTSRPVPPKARTRTKVLTRPVSRPASPKAVGTAGKPLPPAVARRTVSRPVSRRSRPVLPRPGVRSVAKRTPGKRRTIPQLLKLPPLPKQAARWLQQRYAWLTSDGKRRFQQMAGRLWRERRDGAWTDERYLEVRRGGGSVTLFHPERKRWLKLDGQRAMNRRKGDPWKFVATGRWTRGRVPIRTSWVARRTLARVQHIKGPLWVIYMYGKPQKKQVLWFDEANETYVSLRSKGLAVRLYEQKAFRKRLGVKAARWRVLGKGGWDHNPPTYKPDGWMRRLLRKRVRKQGKKSAPVARVKPRRRPQQRPPARQVVPRRLSLTVGRRPVARAKVPQKSVVRPRAKAPSAKPKAVVRLRARKSAPARRSTSGDRRVRVTQPKRSPWRSIAFVRVKKRDGSKIFASGVLIGERLLLTSGHLIYDRANKKTASSLWVYPGLYNRSMHFGATYPVKWAVHPKWINAKDTAEAINHDLAVAWLKKPLGRKAGWLKMRATTPMMTQKQAMTFAGYPLDKFFRTKKLWMWHATRRGHAPHSSSYPWKDRLSTRHKVTKGADGGPLLMRVGKGWAVVGICRRGGDKRADFVRLNAEHIAWIRKVVAHWTQASRPRLDPFSGGDEPPAQLRFWEGDGLDLDQLSQ